MKFVMLLTLLLGIILPLVGLIELAGSAWFVSHAVRTRGEVLACDRHQSSTEWDVSVRYLDSDGVEHTQSTTILPFSNCPDFQTGDTIDVLYDAAAP